MEMQKEEFSMKLRDAEDKIEHQHKIMFGQLHQLYFEPADSVIQDAIEKTELEIDDF